MKPWAWFAFCLLLVTDPLRCTDYECRTIHREGGNLWWNCSDTLYPEFPHPDEIPKGVSLIDLSYNRILDLHRINITCDGYPKCNACLAVLDLRDNEIESIDKDTFQSLFCLHQLDLSHNRIKGEIINEETFQGLHKLKSLSLKGNPLVSVPDSSFLFTELGDLVHLDLSNCKISTIEKLALSELNVLEYIDLSGNELVTIDPEVFRGLHFLHTLDLRHNKLVKLGAESFEPLLVLQTLLLDENHIEVIHPKAFDGLGILETLSLGTNRLKQIPFLALRAMNNLQLFNFSANVAGTLSQSPVRDLKLAITTLIIEDMDTLHDIGNHAFSALHQLRYVHITRNKFLSSIGHDVFSSKHLREVFLNDNGLLGLHEDLLSWDDLDELTLQNNRWRCDCNLKWMLESSRFNYSITCRTPDKYRGRDLMTLTSSDLRCPRSLLTIFISCILGIVAISLVVAAILCWKYRRHIRLRRVKGKYISVYQKDVGDEPTTRIELEETDLVSKYATDD
ncbi:leucine-rich repeat-containing G-protein coupled receptor 5-like [Gigantopelta aegis]|uniref:leucine-rich repeat-containing G-protein coupled receptor 5-like n=1 Tax=Gigantopelta aegis TaxID=1735272 RepID=UPI001B88A705|nr:leucine-rich repeat-containing G-protein coupled receptor 5-like [Gigantopelta aegis]